MAGLHALVIGRQRQRRVERQQRAAFRLGITEMLQQGSGIRMVEIPAGKLDLGAVENIAIAFAAILGGAAEPKTKLNRPHGVSIAPAGALWVSDSWNNRVLILRNYQK